MRVPRLSGAALAGGISMLYLSVIVLIPLAAVVAKSLELRARPVLDGGHQRAGARGAEAHR